MLLCRYALRSAMAVTPKLPRVVRRRGKENVTGMANGSPLCCSSTAIGKDTYVNTNNASCDGCRGVTLSPVREGHTPPIVNSVCTPDIGGGEWSGGSVCTPVLSRHNSNATDVHFIFKGRTPPLKSARVLVDDTLYY